MSRRARAAPASFRHRWAVLSALVVLPLVAACSSPSESTSTTVSTGPPALAVRTVGDLGPVLVGRDGLTVYVNARVKDSPSGCDAVCSAAWPPLVEVRRRPPLLMNGLPAALVGSVELAGGQREVTYNGYGLHTYVGDGQPGQDTGEGVQGAWFAVSPTGMVVPPPVTRGPTTRH